MQTMKLTLELPYDPRVASMLLAATGAALHVEAESAPKPTEQQPGAADAEPAQTPPPEPAEPAASASKRKATSGKAAKAPELRGAPETLEAAATETAPEASKPETPKPETAKPAPQAPATGVSMNDLRKEAVRLAQNGKQAELRDVLESFGASAVSRIPAERYDEALAALQAVETEAKA